MSSSIKYRPEIDGLRCFAVLPVIIFHVRQGVLPGGFLGVDVFFVISGFLITSIILREMTDGSFTLARFWNRRIRRIVPAAAFVLLSISLIFPLFIYKPDLVQISSQKMAALFSYANVYFWKNVGDYWGSAAEESPCLHYWSLSVEEQYYLLYPLLLLLLVRKFRPRLLLFLGAGVLASFAVFAYASVHYPDAAFYLLPTRVWELGLGCMLAVYLRDNPTTQAPLQTLTGLFLMAVAYLFPSGSSETGYESFIAVVGAGLVIMAGHNRVSAVVLENKISVFVGRISYSLYLWHWPILVALREVKSYGTITSGIYLAALGGGALLALGLLSFYLIEVPFRRHKHGSFVALAFASSVAGIILFFEPRYMAQPYASNYAVPTWYGKYYDLKPNGDLSTAAQLMVDVMHSPPRVAKRTAFEEGGIIRLRGTPQPRVVVLGDSHAVMFSKTIDDITGELGLTTSLWSMTGESFLMKVPAVKRPGRYLTSEECLEYDRSRQKLIAQWNPDIVIVGALWERCSEDALAELLDFLEAHAKHVVLLESPPVLEGVSNRAFYQYAAFLGKDASPSTDESELWDVESLGQVQKTRSRLVKYAFNRPKISFLPLADLFLSDHKATVACGRTVYYMDDDHLTEEGAERAYARIKMAIVDLLKNDQDRFPLVSDRGEMAQQTLHAVELASR